MTDISTTAPVTIRRLNLPKPCFPRLEIGASLAALPGLLSEALNMAYAAPYTGLRRQTQVAPDNGLEARDPAW